MDRRIVVAALAAVLLAGCGAKGKDEETEQKPVVEVTLDRTTVADFPLTITAPATIFPHDQASIAGRVTAPIRRLLVRKGDSVRSGQVLAELENTDVAAQKAEAQGAVASAQANLQKTVGGTLPADVERARGQVETTKAALAQAEQVYNRRKALFDQGAIPQRDLLQSQTDLAAARANYNVAEKSLELLLSQSRKGDEAIARASLEQAQAHLQALNAQLQFTEIRAPFAGTITDQMQYPGDMAQPGAPMLTIADLSTVTARAQVPEASAGPVRKGQSCGFRPVDQSDAEITGRVTVVNQAVDPQRRTVEVWCEAPRPPAWVRAGMFGNVSIQTGRVENAVFVPKAAVIREEGTDEGAVFVVDAKHIAHRRDVTLAETEADKVRVVTGLKPGETIVAEGAYGLPDNTQVRLKGEKAGKEEKE